MKEFIFNCPTFGQHILPTKDWVGQHMICPSCKTRIVIAASIRRVRKKSGIAAMANTEIRLPATLPKAGYLGGGHLVPSKLF